MAVTKRTRFEVLRRDDHTCRYCGATAPDAKLTVDHVTPVALGGTDDPTNLVAACRECNSGKASTNPDAAVVAAVRDDAIRHAERLRQAYSVLTERIGEKSDYCDEFLEAWTDDYIATGWRDSVGKFYEMGVPIEVVVDAAESALAKHYVEPGAPRFKYFCGIVWKQCSLATEMVATREAFDGAWMTEADLTTERAHSYEEGYRRGEKAVWKKVGTRYVWGLLPEVVVDSTRTSGGISEWHPLKNLREMVARNG